MSISAISVMPIKSVTNTLFLQNPTIDGVIGLGTWDLSAATVILPSSAIQNIYTVDGTLTSDRILSGGGTRNLTISQIPILQISATSTNTYRLQANSAATHTLSIDAANAGAGAANIGISAKTNVDITATTINLTGTVRAAAIIATSASNIYFAAQPVGLTSGTGNIWMSQSTNLITTGTNNVYIGSTISATGTSSSNVCIGNSSNVSGGNSRVAIGSTAQATGSSTTAVGAGAVASGTSSTSYGWTATANASGATAIGHSASIATTGCIQLNANSVSGTAFGKFRTQTFSDEAWIGGGTTTASIDNSGNIIRTPSDIRLKKDIEVLPLDESMLLIKSIIPKTFKWKDEIRDKLGRATRVGLIAQEVEEVLPKMVYNDAYMDRDIAELEAIDSDKTITEEERVIRRQPHLRKYKGIKDDQIIYHLFNVVKAIVNHLAM